MFKGLIGVIPELITIIVIIMITRYFVRFLRFLASEIENGKLNIPGFYPDWAMSTFNLLKVIIYAFSFVVIFPYLPGSDSPVFQGLGVFFGLLISLGSSSAIGNIIAGVVITYMRPFKIGDRIKVADITGDVIEKTMLVTRLRTIKNEDITIPNAAILNSNTTNYSSSAQDLGLILNTTITIGYDIPWKKVNELLIDAALKTTHIKKEPQPFVLQTSLDDFYVSYQINAYTAEASKAAKIYSELYANIQDGFNNSGVEILSPHYRADRDGNSMAVPSEYLPKDYKAPSFNVKINKDGTI
jgi:small-conductance mechanosensitive channel